MKRICHAVVLIVCLAISFIKRADIHSPVATAGSLGLSLVTITSVPGSITEHLTNSPQFISVLKVHNVPKSFASGALKTPLGSL